jgi:hypothetical protein
MAGWVKLHRELLDKPIWFESTPEQIKILMTLLLMASHKETEWEWKGKKYKAVPGQFVTSLPNIVKKAGKGISIQNVRTALVRFEKYGFLTDESTKQNRLITIVNWLSYQRLDDEEEERNDVDQQTNQQSANSQLTSIKNLRTKELKELKKSPKVSPSDLDYKNAHMLYELRAAKIKPPIDPDFTKWANEFRILRNNFKDHTDEIVERNIRWSQGGFWGTENIRSAPKFRDRYEEIHLDAEKKANRNVLPMFNRKPQHDFDGAIERRLANQKGVVIEIE